MLDSERYLQSSEQVRHLYGELVKRFRQERQQLRPLVTGEGRKELQLLVHRMSGTSAAFGFNAIHKAAEVLERSVQSGADDKTLLSELANVEQALDLSCRSFDRLNQREMKEQ